MPEKVIHEVRVVETDDGFRIEIKGDKERLREFVKRFAEGFPFGPGFKSHRHGPFRGGPFRHGPFRHGPWRHGPRGFGFGFGAGPWWGEEDDQAERQQPDDAPRA